ncbi:MAG: hypothetical protein OEY38_17490 [Gammaproteobacteria bacterium]|nr:hypothetical protein [Gammaproteobacteria bacterium]
MGGLAEFKPPTLGVPDHSQRLSNDLNTFVENLLLVHHPTASLACSSLNYSQFFRQESWQTATIQAPTSIAWQASMLGT